MSSQVWRSTVIRHFFGQQRADVQIAILHFFLPTQMKAASVRTDMRKLFLIVPEGCAN